MNHMEKLRENEKSILSLLSYRKYSKDKRIDNEINRLVRENKRIKNMTLEDALMRETITVTFESRMNHDTVTRIKNRK